MEVRKDFGDRLKALADSTPKEAVANLIRALMPKTQVTTRAPTADYAPTRISPVPMPRDPLAPRKMVRMKWSREDMKTITVTYPEGRSPYKYGTKAWATFQLFRESKTVRDFRMKVAENPDRYDAGYLRYSSRDGYIKIGD